MLQGLSWELLGSHWEVFWGALGVPGDAFWGNGRSSEGGRSENGDILENAIPYSSFAMSLRSRDFQNEANIDPIMRKERREEREKGREEREGRAFVAKSDRSS